jgi:hypothetical protein
MGPDAVGKRKGGVALVVEGGEKGVCWWQMIGEREALRLHRSHDSLEHKRFTFVFISKSGASRFEGR